MAGVNDHSRLLESAILSARGIASRLANCTDGLSCAAVLDANWFDGIEQYGRILAEPKARRAAIANGYPEALSALSHQVTRAIRVISGEHARIIEERNAIVAARNWARATRSA